MTPAINWSYFLEAPDVSEGMGVRGWGGEGEGVHAVTSEAPETSMKAARDPRPCAFTTHGEAVRDECMIGWFGVLPWKNIDCGFSMEGKYEVRVH